MIKQPSWQTLSVQEFFRRSDWSGSHSAGVDEVNQMQTLVAQSRSVFPTHDATAPDWGDPRIAHEHSAEMDSPAMIMIGNDGDANTENYWGLTVQAFWSCHNWSGHTISMTKPLERSPSQPGAKNTIVSVPGTFDAACPPPDTPEVSPNLLRLTSQDFFHQLNWYGTSPSDGLEPVLARSPEEIGLILDRETLPNEPEPIRSDVINAEFLRSESISTASNPMGEAFVSGDSISEEPIREDSIRAHQPEPIRLAEFPKSSEPVPTLPTEEQEHVSLTEVSPFLRMEQASSRDELRLAVQTFFERSSWQGAPLALPLDSPKERSPNVPTPLSTDSPVEQAIAVEPAVTNPPQELKAADPLKLSVNQFFSQANWPGIEKAMAKPMAAVVEVSASAPALPTSSAQVTSSFPHSPWRMTVEHFFRVPRWAGPPNVAPQPTQPRSAHFEFTQPSQPFTLKDLPELF